MCIMYEYPINHNNTQFKKGRPKESCSPFLARYNRWKDITFTLATVFCLTQLPNERAARERGHNWLKSLLEQDSCCCTFIFTRYLQRIHKKMTQKLKIHLMKMQVQVICYEIDGLFLQLDPNLTTNFQSFCNNLIYKPHKSNTNQMTNVIFEFN